MRHGWQSAYPGDWCVAGCPIPEMAPLHDFEYSRESGWMRAQVNFIRHGQIPAPSFWSLTVLWLAGVAPPRLFVRSKRRTPKAATTSGCD